MTAIRTCEGCGVRLWLVKEDGKEVWMEKGGKVHVCPVKPPP